MNNVSVEATSNFALWLKSMSVITDEKLTIFLSKCYRRELAAQEIFLNEGDLVDKVYFIESGIVRHYINDSSGNEHTSDFMFENQFDTDYSAYVSRTKAAYNLQALKPTRLIVIPREAYDWIIHYVVDGERLIRLVTENFFIYFEKRLRERYLLTPLERYQALEEKFPEIYTLVPQYMIASYIGVSKVHLSRLKNQNKEEEE